MRHFYDAYGEREWERLEANASGRVGFHIHNLFLHRYVQPGDHILEAGAGPGRFTIELARLGAKVTVGDISPVQLELNRQKSGKPDLSKPSLPGKSWTSWTCPGSPPIVSMQWYATAVP